LTSLGPQFTPRGQLAAAWATDLKSGDQKIQAFSRANQAVLKALHRQRCHAAGRRMPSGMPSGRCLQENDMGRIIGFLFGLVAYLVFFMTVLYAIGFVTGFGVPKTIDTGPGGPTSEAMIVNVLLLSLFALQHSGMARKPFKRWLTQFVPAAIERSVYVLLASLVLMLLLWQWRPIPALVWQVTNPQVAATLTALSLAGWLLVLFSSFLINHFELFGLQQVAANLARRAMPAPRFKTPALYKIVRHPIYLGFIIAFWAAPVMTVGHLLFAAVTTAYIFMGIALEERDLIQLFGEEYKRYRAQVGMLVPFRRKPS
jgi:protein-S-isoprenylcysteine O-methyltransferase Ste14